MKLSNLLSTHFENHVRLRGSGYYHSGAVRIKSGSETAVDARVTGAREYRVELTWDGKQLNVRCSCPYFDSSGPCKHLWAVVLAAEALGYLADATGSKGKLVINDDLFDAETMDGYRKPPKLKVLAPPVAARPPQPRVVAPPHPTWRDRLKQVATVGGMLEERWPADRQLIYIVDTAASVSLGSVVLNVMSCEPKRDGGWKKALQ
jgi:hypothetical protein